MFTVQTWTWCLLIVLSGRNQMRIFSKNYSFELFSPRTSFCFFVCFFSKAHWCPCHDSSAQTVPYLKKKKKKKRGYFRSIFSRDRTRERLSIHQISVLRLRSNLMLPLITEDLYSVCLLALTYCYQISRGELNPDLCLWDGWNNTILGSVCNCVIRDTIYRGVI